MSTPDYSAYQEETAPEVSLDEVQREAAKMLDAQERVDELKAELDRAEDALKLLARETIPELLERAGLSEIKLAGGAVVTLKEAVHGSIIKSREEEAFAWMEENGYGSLIKRNFNIKFGRDDEAWADKFARDCSQRKKPLDLVRVKKVEPMTLKKFIKDRSEEGTELPEAFSTHRYVAAKLTVPTG